jgi:hypothetical protein
MLPPIAIPTDGHKVPNVIRPATAECMAMIYLQLNVGVLVQTPITVATGVFVAHIDGGSNMLINRLAIAPHHQLSPLNALIRA